MDMRPSAGRQQARTLLILVAVALLPIVSVRNAPAAAPPVSEPAGQGLLDIDPHSFGHSTNIDNQWFPLKPGTQLVYEGSHAGTDGERVPHRDVFTVTDLTKVIDGVRTVVILDADYAEDQLEELELTFFAQDNGGNVWHLGQYRETYDGADFVGGQAWLVGALEGAKAGIMMQAAPRLGTPSYSEGYAPTPFNWSDRGQVYQMGQKVRVPTGSYEDVMVIKEFNQEERGAFQLKYYARGVGVVRVGWGGNDQEQEELALVKRAQLDPAAIGQVRAKVLEMEAHAYVYSRTAPAEQSPPA
jgi:hypothetical protein